MLASEYRFESGMIWARVLNASTSNGPPLLVTHTASAPASLIRVIGAVRSDESMGAVSWAMISTQSFMPSSRTPLRYLMVAESSARIATFFTPSALNDSQNVGAHCSSGLAMVKPYVLSGGMPFTDETEVTVMKGRPVDSISVFGVGTPCWLSRKMAPLSLSWARTAGVLVASLSSLPWISSSGRPRTPPFLLTSSIVLFTVSNAGML